MILTDVPVFYINLEDEVEKGEAVRLLLSGLGFKNVTRVPGVVNSVRKTGVALAHQSALETAIPRGFPFIILEDDVVAKNFKNEIFVPEGADAYYLGISRWGLKSGVGTQRISAERFDDKTFRLFNMLSAHAILYLNKDYAEFILKSTKFYASIGTNQDKGRAETMKYWNVYGSSDPLFAQEGKYLPHTSFILPSRETKTSRMVFL
jgi:hypothetical protein